MPMKVISQTRLSDTLELTECIDGWWLYDETRSMNIAMKATTKDDAFVEALTYYQESMVELSLKYRDLKKKVDQFVSSLSVDE